MDTETTRIPVPERLLEVLQIVEDAMQEPEYGEYELVYDSRYQESYINITFGYDVQATYLKENLDKHRLVASSRLGCTVRVEISIG